VTSLSKGIRIDFIIKYITKVSKEPAIVEDELDSGGDDVEEVSARKCPCKVNPRSMLFLQ
jgi:hypothetical protein